MHTLDISTNKPTAIPSSIQTNRTLTKNKPPPRIRYISSQSHRTAIEKTTQTTHSKSTRFSTVVVELLTFSIVEINARALSPRLNYDYSRIVCVCMCVVCSPMA